MRLVGFELEEAERKSGFAGWQLVEMRDPLGEVSLRPVMIDSYYFKDF